MYKLAEKKAKALFCGAILASTIAAMEAAQAAPPVQAQHPHIFTPNCAARPRCVENICLRMGRCSFGSHTQAMGCLIYACKHSAH